MVAASQRGQVPRAGSHLGVYGFYAIGQGLDSLVTLSPLPEPIE